MTIVFDDGAADALIAAAHGASGDLRSQAMANRVRVEAAVWEFRGSYATVFTTGSTMRSEDTQRLAGVFADLGTAIERAKREAGTERRRLRESREWRAREADRAKRRASGDPLAVASAYIDGVVDPRPDDTAAHPTPVTATFAPRARPRTGGGSSGGTSSADPDALLTFVGASRAADNSTAQHLIQVKNAWTRFRSACSWVPVEGSTVVSGFDGLMAENALEASWLEGIANAFDRAGGSALSNLTLDAVATVTASPALSGLLRPGLTPAEVASAYARLPQTDGYIESLPLATQYLFANLDGIPAAKRDIASRAVLAAAVEDPEQVYTLMGFGEQRVGLSDFEQQVHALQEAVDEADLRAEVLPGLSDSKTAQLVGFGVHDGALVAAVSLGDLDTAENVTVNVPGMSSDVSGMGERIQAAEGLLRQARIDDRSQTYAVVSWVGYHAPNPAEVGFPDRSESGAAELASFVDGVFDSRPGGGPGTFTVAAHSYGSTTAVQGLQLTEHRVDSFVSYGSVGFPRGTEIGDVHADNVYATAAKDDPLAPVGQWVGVATRADPLGFDGVQEFSSEAGDGTYGVTGHDMWHDSDSDDVGYLSQDSTTLHTLAQIVADGKMGP
ncbi:alpha/beta hydrolase [Curtobacterium sp. VKM Ac-2922]|uniref:alpha/beta hydrolase n=1 Tax=Curtobacterium sp. VKM Ac-2922 TaxID=2929475 RepID=UPI001FB56C03|nr:alpha/beta hydrolase [Curtobacterium sp. VKM Ac-2922]MCJ1712960.1 alpha/beta hydrolase family protein [Curtobacterium sp. VKM Ac-2922]